MASPIEDALLRRILETVPPRVVVHYRDERIGSADGDRAVLLYRQHEIAEYRVDLFLEIDGGQFHMAIECDGHDWHERTKQQAAYDRARDRELMCLGVFTIRFTGSEIVHSPGRCAADTWRCTMKLLDLDELYLQRWFEGRHHATAAGR
jgi:very-short-patch-repair endonuclease